MAVPRERIARRSVPGDGLNDGPGVAPPLWLALFLDPVGRRMLTRRES